MCPSLTLNLSLVAEETEKQDTHPVTTSLCLWHHLLLKKWTDTNIAQVIQPDGGGTGWPLAPGWPELGSRPSFGRPPPLWRRDCCRRTFLHLLLLPLCFLRCCRRSLCDTTRPHTPASYYLLPACPRGWCCRPRPNCQTTIQNCSLFQQQPFFLLSWLTILWPRHLHHLAISILHPTHGPYT